MGFSLTVHLVAGLGALVMGIAVLLRGPARPRHRSFAMLCAALALWNLSAAGLVAFGSRGFWVPALRLGASAAAVAGVVFATRLAGWSAPARRSAIGLAALPAAALWVASWTALPGRPAWPWISIGVLGGISAVSLFAIAQRAVRLSAGPERRALHAVFWGGLVAVAGGLTDFLPRGPEFRLPDLGPLGVLAFLFVVSAVVVRHRFLDVERHLLGVVAWIVAGTAVALAFWSILPPGESRRTFAELLLVGLGVVGIGWLVGVRIWGGAWARLRPDDPVGRILGESSGRFATADRAEAVWEIVADGVARIPGTIDLAVYWKHRGDFALVWASRPPDRDRGRGAKRKGGDGHGGSDVERSTGDAGQASGAPDRQIDVGERADDNGALPRLLAAERRPLTRGFLERERDDAGGEAGGERGREASAALEALARRDARLVVPLVRGADLVGWIELRGDLPERYQTAEVSAAFTALGNQAAEAFQRIAAAEGARRREALAAVGELAAGLAHEVRNPVAAIRGAAQAIGPRASAEQQREMLEVIEEESERLSRVVGEFLDYARPNAPRRDAVDLAEVARQVLRAAALAGWRLEAEVRVSGAAPRVAGDADQLRRVLENLVRNAWEATGDGGRVAIEVGVDAPGRVAVRVTDDGPGIDAERLDRLFLPFHTTKPGGTGLGLALVHRVVETHGGEVRVESAPGAGATFTVILDAFGD